MLSCCTQTFIRSSTCIYSRNLVDVILEQHYCRIANLVGKDLAQRQAAPRHLKDLAAIGVLREMTAGKENDSSTWNYSSC